MLDDVSRKRSEGSKQHCKPSPPVRCLPSASGKTNTTITSTGWPTRTPSAQKRKLSTVARTFDAACRPASREHPATIRKPPSLQGVSTWDMMPQSEVINRCQVQHSATHFSYCPRQL